MELLIIWLGTVVISLGLDTAITFQMFKDVADQGYKIDIKRLKELGEQLNPEARKMNIIRLFVPIANILLKFDQMLKYNQSRPFIADQLRIMDCIAPFSKDEEEDYNKKPTRFNAIVTTIKSERNKMTEDMTASLSVIEQNAKIDEILEDLVKSIKEITEEESSNLLKDELSKKGNATVDLGGMSVREELLKPSTTGTTELSFAEQKEQLEQLKESVIAATQEQPTENKGHSLSKKK